MMKIPSPGAISKLGIRLRERRQRAGGDEDPALTSDDESNITEFEGLVRKTNALLQRENEALGRGEVERVAEFFSAKQELLKFLQLRQPLVEPFLRKQIPEIVTLRDHVKELSENLKRNGQLLSGMAEASRSIVSEVERIRKRQGLDGIYDKSGQIRPNLGSTDRKVEKNL